MMRLATATEVLLAVGTRLDQRGLAPATSGNYSMRLDDGSIAITVSGAHKGRLRAEHIMRVDRGGVALDDRRPSAETPLHTLIYALDSSAECVLHTHSVSGTVLSRALNGRSSIDMEGYELFKSIPGLYTHECRVAIPLVDNSQDMLALAIEVKAILSKQSPLLPAFYIRGHGLYAWGATLEQAERVVEACEFLLSCAWEEWKCDTTRGR